MNWNTVFINISSAANDQIYSIRVRSVSLSFSQIDRFLINVMISTTSCCPVAESDDVCGLEIRKNGN